METNLIPESRLTRTWQIVCPTILLFYCLLHASIWLKVENPICNLPYTVFSPYTRDVRVTYAASYFVTVSILVGRIFLSKYSVVDQSTKASHCAALSVAFLSMISAISSWLYEYGGVCEDYYG